MSSKSIQLFRMLTICAAIAGGSLDMARATERLPLSSVMADGKADDRSRAVACLTGAVLFEAGYEPLAGQQAVAEVVMNRLRSPAFPKTVCGVVFQGSGRRSGCQFTFTCDGSLRKILPVSLVQQARTVALAAIDGLLMPRLSGATHYHADFVQPYWAPSLVKVTSIGHHVFYRMPGTRDLQPASPTRPTQTAPFMPWGLAPNGQTASASSTLSISNE